ncbi:MAG TPA: acyl-CoA dehydrogenase family protein [Solirubrobacteraceae bacterium]|nr:acyl-CoA dehydrogenase family protein [Solirubrobacteraceae bacterium]
MAEVAVGNVDSVLAEVRDLAGSRIAPSAAEIDRESRFPDEQLRALGEVGALGLLVPREHGGAGAGLVALAAACEAIGGACASTGMVFLMHSVSAATVAGGGGKSAARLLAGMSSGEVLGTLAFSERGTGAHFYAPELRAERRDGSVHVSGRKAFVTSGGHADAMLVLLQSEGEGLDCFVVRQDAPGVRFEGHWEGLGMRGNSSIAVELEDVGLDDDARIGEAGGAADLVFGVVAPTFLVGLAAVNVGIAQAALSSALEHATSRRYPDGSALVEVATVQHALADMDIAVRAARTLLQEAARLGDSGDEGALVPLMEAKILCTDVAARVTQAALEVCGGQGYTPALPIERHLRDARAGAVMAPTNGVLRTWSAKAIAGLPVP